MHCCCGIVNAIFKRVCPDGRISQARALPPLLQSVVQSVTQAAAHIPSEIRDAPQPTKDGNFDLATHIVGALDMCPFWVVRSRVPQFLYLF